MIPKISIIIPIYKTERYLRECLDSVLVQTYTDWECLLIDDGSPDRCGVICDEYSKRDSRFRVFHKENGGVSSARNVGLDNCIGELVAFVDSDDTIAPDYLESVNEFEGDLMILGNNNSNGIPSDFMQDGLYVQFECKQFISSHLRTANLRGPWAKIYKRSILSGIYFDRKVRVREDVLFNLQYYKLCTAIKVATRFQYNYTVPQCRKDYCNISVDMAIYTLSSIYNEYKKLSVNLPIFMLSEYYCFRQMIEWNIQNVKKWFNNPTIKEIYTKHINSSLCFHVSHFRWWIVAMYKDYVYK